MAGHPPGPCWAWRRDSGSTGHRRRWASRSGPGTPCAIGAGCPSCGWRCNSPSTLPEPIPGRALSLGSRAHPLLVPGRAAHPSRSLPRRPDGDPHRRPVRAVHGERVRGRGSAHRGLPGRRSAAPVAAAAGAHRGLATRTRSGPTSPRRSSRASGRTSRATPSTASTGSRPRARWSSRSRSSTSSRPPTCGCSWTSIGPCTRAPRTTPRSRPPSVRVPRSRRKAAASNRSVGFEAAGTRRVVVTVGSRAAAAAEGAPPAGGRAAGRRRAAP